MSATVNKTSGAIIGNNVTARETLFASSIRSNGKPIQFHSNVCFEGDAKINGDIAVKDIAKFKIPPTNARRC
jgi:hypothetical protein